MDESNDDGVERTLRLIRGLQELGIVPLSVTCGDCVVQVSAVLRNEEGQAEQQAPGARSYVGRAMSARKVG